MTYLSHPTSTRLRPQPTVSGCPWWAERRRGTIPMPLDPRMLNSVVRISSHGTLLGTGSIISVPSATIPGKRWPYVVTADHVVANQDGIELEVPNRRNNGKLFDPIPAEPFTQPLDGIDLAMAVFPTDRVPHYQETRIEHFVPEGHVGPLGCEIYYLGIFAGPDVPMARSGTLGTIDIPIDKTKNGRRYRYSADLVDCRSYGGFSGSPCFSVLNYAALDTPANVPDEFVPVRPDGSRPELVPVAAVASFCGVFVAHYDDPPPGRDVESKYGVGIMLPSDYVLMVLTSDEAKKDQSDADADWQRRKAAEGPQPQDAGAQDAGGEFERFEELTRQLVNTPKPEKG